MESERAYQGGWWFCVNVGVVIVLCLGVVVYAYEPIGNIAPEELDGLFYTASTTSTSFPFDPNSSFLLYNPRGSQTNITQVFSAAKWDIPYTERNSDTGNHVTLADLQSHDILIVGWNNNGDTTGLDPAVLAEGITGRIILSGHDSDYHTYHGPQAAETLLMQKIRYVLSGSGTGMIVLGDETTTPFDYLPQEWEVVPYVNGSEYVSEFTPEGLLSGVFDDITPAMLCDWKASYHNTFGEWGTDFVAFELGGTGGQEVITIARANTYRLDLIKTDNIDPNSIPCVMPDDEITYTIYYSRMVDSTSDLEEVVLVDLLPVGVDYLYEWVDGVPVYPGDITIDPNDIWEWLNDPNFAGFESHHAVYDPTTHTLMWPLGTIEPGEDGSVSFVVQVNDLSEPNGILLNRAELWDATELLRVATVETSVCCWDDGVIYVNRHANGANTGTSWTHAYTDLQSALGRANIGCGGEEIWVAAGHYSPGDQSDDSFEIPAGVAVYGGFAGWETSLEQRNLHGPATVLTGLISEEGWFTERNSTVVKMGDGSLLDGVTVKEGDWQGIDGSDVSSEIINCIIQNNIRIGVYCENGNLNLKWCVIKNNGEQGVWHEGSAETLIVENNKIYNNYHDGVYTALSTSIVINSLIYQNGIAGNYFGINMVSPYSTPTIRNNTIVQNANEAIRFVGSNVPDVRNCILYYNNANEPNSPQLAGFDTTYYSCIFDPNSTSSTPDANGNIHCEPGFVYDGEPYGYYHLRYESYCRNAGDNAFVGQDELDIDGEPRIQENVVDIGADEVSCMDTWNALDWNYDGVINLHEFAMFSRAWLTHDPNDPQVTPDMNNPVFYNWNPKYNMDATGASAYSIDTADLIALLDNWLWTACWKQIPVQSYSMMSAGQQSIVASESYATKGMESTTGTDPAIETANIIQIIDFLDDVLLEGHDNLEGVLGMKAILEDWLNMIDI